MADTIDTFTAVLDGSGQWFNITISAPDFDTFTLTRALVGGGASSVVRGCNNAALSGLGAANLIDVEVPQNTSVRYFLEVNRPSPAPTSVTSSWITATGQIDHGANVIFDLARNSVPTPVRVNDWSSLSHDAPSEAVWVEGRRDPVVVTSTRRLPSSELTLLTLDNNEYNAILDVLSGGITCYAPRYPAKSGMPDGVVYLSVTAIQELRMNQQDGEPARYMRMTVQEIAAPPADFIPMTARTWDSAIALGLTWDALAAAYTWDELAFG